MALGFDALNKSITEAANRSAQGFSGKLNYFNWKNGETKVLRFLTDEVLTVPFYEMVVDNQGKFKDFIVAPRLHEDDPNWTGEDWVLKYGGKQHENGMSGPLIAPTAKVRSACIAVLREEAPREVNGKTVMGYQDYLHEITVGGKDFPARYFGIVKQSLQLFWGQMSGYHHEFGTICDRDYKIKRVGERLDTSYQIIPMREDENFDIRALQESYGYGKPRDKDDEERFLFCPQTVQEWADNYAGEERAKYWLGDPKAAAQTQAQATNGTQYGAAEAAGASGLDEFRKETTHNPAPDEAQAAPPPASDFSALRARLEKHT